MTQDKEICKLIVTSKGRDLYDVNLVCDPDYIARSIKIMMSCVERMSMNLSLIRNNEDDK